MSNRTSPTIDRLEEWLKRFRYKPGFQFEIQRDQLYGDVLFVRTPVWKDSRSEETKYSRGNFTFPLNLHLFSSPNGEELFKNWMRRSVIYHIEQHEADEWLFYDGVRIWDPHASKVS